jgi:hypothetical protein
VALVAALRLAQGVLRARHVEDVVDDLEEEPELGREASEACECSATGAPVIDAVQQQHALDRGSDQPPGLQLVEPP